MSKATKRKHVTKEVLEDFPLPEGDRQIVKVVAGRGNNLHEVETGDGQHFLASMPTKFRKNVWIKRGDYVIVEPIEEGDKVKGEILHILYNREHIKYIQAEGMWPARFAAQTAKSGDGMIPDDMLPPGDSDSGAESGDEVELTRNPNRPQVTYYESDASSEDEEEEMDRESNNERQKSDNCDTASTACDTHTKDPHFTGKDRTQHTGT